MTRRGQRVQRVIGSVALLMAVIWMLWLLLGMLEMVPLVLQFPGESRLRTHGAAAVFSLLVAAWGFWEHEA